MASGSPSDPAARQRRGAASGSGLPEPDRRIGPAEIGRLLIAPLLVILLVFAAGLATGLAHDTVAHATVAHATPAHATPVHAAEPDFPKLDGRVTDAAGVLAPEARARIEAKLKAHEDRTSDQLVVATVPNLQGLTVEDYANRLFRAWKLGQKPKNNGVLLLVAPSARKLRIEVGYGLEGALTDALSKVIVTTAITPKFKQGDLAGGIEAGADAILSILSGDAEEWQRRAEIREDAVDPVQVIVWVVIILVLVVLVWRTSAGAGRGRRRGDDVIFLPGSSGNWSGGFSGGSGGFSGGGGSSGGGGASGDW